MAHTPVRESSGGGGGAGGALCLVLCPRSNPAFLQERAWEHLGSVLHEIGSLLFLRK